ncbi:MAG: RNA polymerase sigma factor [Actinomycetota bacterium]
MTGQEPDVPTPTVSPAPEAVVEQAPLDDETRFRRLFETGYQPLVAYARRRTLNPAAADDVVAETFATAWRRRADLRPGAAPLPWLYGIAANVLRNQRRSQGRALRLVDRLHHDPLTAAVAEVDLELPDPELHDALDRLSFDDREILRLVTWEEMSHAEIAETLGCSVNAVGIRLHRARKRLRHELDITSIVNPDHR